MELLYHAAASVGHQVRIKTLVTILFFLSNRPKWFPGCSDHFSDCCLAGSVAPTVIRQVDTGLLHQWLMNTVCG